MARGYNPPPLSERSTPELLEALDWFRNRVRRWSEYHARSSGTGAKLFALEVEAWTGRAEAVEAELTRRGERGCAACAEPVREAA